MITTNTQVPADPPTGAVGSWHPRRWPLLLLGLPAGVAIWSGWVGLGQMAGFGIVHPLPGIADRFELNSAITLPIGVEAYSAYALGTWLSAQPIAGPARRFASWSSLAALALGLLGQVVYHLLSAAGHTTAPTAVVVFVACLPVLVLGAGAALHHLLTDPVTGVNEADEVPTPTSQVIQPAPTTRASTAPGRKRARSKRTVQPRRLLADYLTDARAQLTPGTDPTSAWCRRVTGCSAGTSVKLAALLRAEQTDPEPPPSYPAPVDGTDINSKERAA